MNIFWAKLSIIAMHGDVDANGMHDSYEFFNESWNEKKTIFRTKMIRFVFFIQKRWISRYYLNLKRLPNFKMPKLSSLKVKCT